MSATKIGTSLTMCLTAIHKGEIAIDDVQFIVTGTAYKSRDDMVAGVRQTMLSKAVGIHVANACLLWDTGRIFQASVRPVTRRATKTWFDGPEFFEQRT